MRLCGPGSPGSVKVSVFTSRQPWHASEIARELLFDPLRSGGHAGVRWQICIHAGKCVARMEVHQRADGLADLRGGDLLERVRDGGIGRRGGDGSAEALSLLRLRGNGRLGDSRMSGPRAYRHTRHSQAGEGAAGPARAAATGKVMQSRIPIHTRIVSYSRGTLTHPGLVSKTSRKAFSLRMSPETPGSRCGPLRRGAAHRLRPSEIDSGKFSKVGSLGAAAIIIHP